MKAKLERDIQTILSFVSLFLVVTFMVWACYDLTASFFGLPLANPAQIGGMLGLLYFLVLGVSYLRKWFR